MNLSARILIAVLCTATLACSTVTVNPNDEMRRASAPTVQMRKHFFVFGLVGKHRVDVKRACDGRTPVQMQARTTFVDSLAGIFTLGLWSPRSVRLWCE